MKPFTKIASILLVLVSLFHIARIILNIPLIVGGLEIPMWVSVFGFIAPFLLGIGMWRELK